MADESHPPTIDDDDQRRGPLLLAYDGSSSADEAIDVAAALFPAGHETVVLSVWSEDASSGQPLPLRLLGALLTLGRGEDEEEAAGARANIAAAFARDAGLHPRERVVREQDSTWRTIIDTAAEERAEAIVVGARGLGDLGRAFVGSVSDSVVRGARCPVVIVHDGGSASVGGPIMFCHDGTKAATDALRTAAGCLRPDREALVLAVWPPLRSEDGPAAAASVRQALEAGLGPDLERARATRTAERAVAELREAGFDAKPLVVERHGVTTWQAVVDAAAEHDASLVVMGARGLRGVKRALLGSVSEQVVRSADRPVMVVRTERAR